MYILLSHSNYIQNLLGKQWQVALTDVTQIWSYLKKNINYGTYVLFGISCLLLLGKFHQNVS